MNSIALLRRGTKSNRGSTLAAALALVFLIFAVTTICLARVASVYAESSARRGQTTALYLADAGIQKAAHRLTQNPAYSGEKGIRLPTGSFDVKVSRTASGYELTSIGYANSPFKNHPKRTVRATVRILSSSRSILSLSKDALSQQNSLSRSILSLSKDGSFRISDWRENR